MTGSEPWNTPARDAERTARIRRLNDQLRTRFTGGRIVLTRGLQELAGEELPALLFRVRRFDRFDSRSDPYQEHDFGALEWNGQTIFWKIDYYDPDLMMRSPDPSDPAVTARVLTIMLGEEY